MFGSLFSLPKAQKKLLTLKPESCINITTKLIASSSNGRTADSDSVNRGSNPCEAATHKKKHPLWVFFLWVLVAAWI